MSFELKIGLFWALVLGIRWFIGRFPGSTAARWLLSWNGPFPEHGETRSSYYRRKVWFALGWLLQIMLAGAALALLAWLSPEFGKSDAVLVSMFALTLGLGMALLGALLAALTSLKAALMGPNPQFLARQLIDTADSEFDPPPEVPR